LAAAHHFRGDAPPVNAPPDENAESTGQRDAAERAQRKFRHREAPGERLSEQFTAPVRAAGEAG
jgi:hypothetical protein